MTKRITKDEWDHMNWLHIYGQFSYHSEATVKGTKDGLTQLRDAIDAALATGRGEATVIASDGEGYRVEVISVSTHGELGSPEYVFEEGRRFMSEEAERARQYGLRDPFGEYMRVDDPRTAERVKEIADAPDR